MILLHSLAWSVCFFSLPTCTIATVRSSCGRLTVLGEPRSTWHKYLERHHCHFSKPYVFLQQREGVCIGLQTQIIVCSLMQRWMWQHLCRDCWHAISLARAPQLCVEWREGLGELLQLRSVPPFPLQHTHFVYPNAVAFANFLCCVFRHTCLHSCLQRCSLEEKWEYSFLVGTRQTTCLGNLFLLRNFSWAYFGALVLF